MRALVAADVALDELEVASDRCRMIPVERSSIVLTSWPVLGSD